VLPRLTYVLVHGLLNPCECGDECACGACVHHPEASLSATPPKASTGLVVLARAAALLEGSASPGPKLTKPRAKKAVKRSASPTTPPVQLKRTKPHPDLVVTPAPKASCCTAKRAGLSLGPALPPLLLQPTPSAGPAPRLSLPTLDVPARASSHMQVVAAGGCCCGAGCSCPGCTEHRGGAHADSAHANCASGDCPTCVDNDGEPGLRLLPLPPFALVPAPSAAALDALYARRPFL
jgi:hypothetical protein